MYAHIFVKVHHGVVPVYEDGSAHFTVPADRNTFFQALDESYMEVQRMRSFVNRPTSCRCRRVPWAPTPAGSSGCCAKDTRT